MPAAIASLAENPWLMLLLLVAAAVVVGSGLALWLLHHVGRRR